MIDIHNNNIPITVKNAQPSIEALGIDVRPVITAYNDTYMTIRLSRYSTGIDNDFDVKIVLKEG